MNAFISSVGPDLCIRERISETLPETGSAASRAAAIIAAQSVKLPAVLSTPVSRMFRFFGFSYYFYYFWY